MLHASSRKSVSKRANAGRSGGAACRTKKGVAPRKNARKWATALSGPAYASPLRVPIAHSQKPAVCGATARPKKASACEAPRAARARTCAKSLVCVALPGGAVSPPATRNVALLPSARTVVAVSSGEPAAVPSPMKIAQGPKSARRTVVARCAMGSVLPQKRRTAKSLSFA